MRVAPTRLANPEMLKSLHVKGFKSLTDLRVEFPQLTVLFGPNAAGKSNLLEAVQMLSRIGTTRSVLRRLYRAGSRLPDGSLRFPLGRPARAIQEDRGPFLAGGEPGMRCWSDVLLPDRGPDPTQIRQFDGAGRIPGRLGKQGRPQGTPVIEPVGEQLHLRRKSKPATPPGDLGAEPRVAFRSAVGGRRIPGYRGLPQ